MSKPGSLPDRALELAGLVGDNLKQALPGADKLLQTGAVVGALKVGTRTVGAFVRRNPVIAVAAVAGAGLLWYAARRKARQAEAGPIDGTARRVDAIRGDAAEPARPARSHGTSRKARHSDHDDEASRVSH